MVAQEQFPDDPLRKEWVDKLKRDFTEDVTKWPKIGCEAQLYLFRNGPSMVVELFIEGT